jgi:DNA-binding NarL/FixJ family response regulator
LPPIRVLICDDSLGFPTLLQTWLRDDGRFEVVGRATGGEQAKTLVADESPDAIVLDLLLPDVPDPPTLVRDLRALHPGLRVLIISSLARDLLEEAATAAGADGWVNKGATATELTNQLYAVASSGEGAGT